MSFRTRILRNFDWSLFVILVIAGTLRFTNLGYSDYQGDEIKALFLPTAEESTTDFLLDQRKGPVQFLVTFLVRFVNPEYNDQLITRLPFALASFFAVFFFYKFIETVFNRRLAFLVSFFLATNGFLVAFGRIVQYQSFILFFEFLSLYLMSLAIYKNKTKSGVFLVYLSLISWGLAILSHYNGIFIAPFMIYFLFLWFKKAEYSFRFKITNFILSGVLSAGILLSFYLPFFMSLDSSTLSYWNNRISGGDGKISSSYFLFTVYQPIYVVHIYTILFFLGLLTYFKKNIHDFFIQHEKLIVLMWGILPLIFLELAINIPGTHIFNYLIPGMIVMGFGIELILKILKKMLVKTYLFNSFFYLGVSMVFLFIFLQSYFIFVDNNFEYPWESEKFLIWEFNKPSAVYHLSMFGFPYNRNWEDVREFVKQNSGSSFYTTNERDSIVRYYVPLVKSGESIGYYVYVLRPQSFTEEILNKRAKAWISENQPVKVFQTNGRDSLKIYLLPKEFQPLSAK